jgi:hypothetical protein
MPFEQVKTEQKLAAGPRASISYSRWGGKQGKKKTRPKLIIGLNAAAVAECKLKADQTFELMLGTGKDAGSLRAMPAKLSGAVTRSRMKGSFSISFGFVPMLGEDAAAKEFVAIRAVQGGGFEIDAPAWFKPEGAA